MSHATASVERSEKLPKAGNTGLQVSQSDAMQVLVIDNYDSFTWNLVHLVHQVCPGAEVRVERNDAILVSEAEAWGPTHLLISPGPCTPTESGCSREMLTHFGGQIPALGVCLGHQSLADVHGGTVDRAPRLMHGKTSLIHHSNEGLHANLPNPFTAMRYHSLIVERDDLPSDLSVTAWTEEGEIMGLMCPGTSGRFAVHGVQYHPESFLTQGGDVLMHNFLTEEPQS